MDTTQKTIAQMLTENTGRHFLDSGGAYGRHWEQNQEVDFDASPYGSLRFGVYGGQVEIEASLSVYHWLTDRVIYAPQMQARFDAYSEARPDEHWLQLMEGFTESIDATGLYGEGEPMIINTYNGEDLLSQTLQYVYFETEDECYVLLQIHGGCDVRGGYTAPKAFSLNANWGECAIFDNACATITAEYDAEAERQIPLPGIPPAEDPNWYTDDGYRWYRDGSTVGTQLEDYDVVESDDADDWERGKLRIDSDGHGYCPSTGRRLEIS